MIKELLTLLENNARYEVKDLAALLNEEEAKIADTIKEISVYKNGEGEKPGTGGAAVPRVDLNGEFQNGFVLMGICDNGEDDTQVDAGFFHRCEKALCGSVCGRCHSAGVRESGDGL